MTKRNTARRRIPSNEANEQPGVLGLGTLNGYRENVAGYNPNLFGLSCFCSVYVEIFASCHKSGALDDGSKNQDAPNPTTMKSLNFRFRFPAATGALLFSAVIAAILHAEEKAKEPAVPAETAATAPAPVDPKLKETLKLTDEQWSQFETILMEKETRSRAELDRHSAAQRMINSETDAKLAAVLTEEQVTAYFATERKGNMDRLNSIAAEIRKRRELRQPR